MRYPILATRGIIVFPKHSSIIEVGRTISKNAVDYAKVKTDKKLVLVSQRDISKDEINNAVELYSVGTLVNFVEKINPDKSKRITATGISRVKVYNLNFNNGYVIDGQIEELVDESFVSDEEEAELIGHISKELEKALALMGPLSDSVITSLTKGISASELTDVISHYMPFKLKEKQKLLETVDIFKRLELISSMFNFNIKGDGSSSDVDLEIDNKIKDNLDKQHREFLLREKLKTIKEELGELSSKETEVDKWRKELKDARFPEEVRKTALEEIKKFESMPSISAESHVTKGYIDWILKLPWRKYSEDNKDIEKAKGILDKYHFGLEKVKERIIEHLAVKINTKSASAPILALVGPPGVGKTSLGESIAEAVGREFIKVSLGGVRDEAEIRGHRRTYVGAMPGKIIQAMNKAKTSNPIILLDEIDKMAADFRGDPTSAMLEVLDPEQNKRFQDHYLELEYDLSKVMFIATANYFEQIPGPLKDRIETIFISQYTSEEKEAITKQYLIPRVLKENGLKKKEFKIDKQTIVYIIDKYTKEAGVRGLQRVLSKLARKIVLEKVNGTLKGEFVLNKITVKKLLDAKEIHKEVVSDKKEVGIVHGMYFSEVGGGILPIEVNTYPSDKPAISLTGSIKDVMKESLDIALAYIRSNAKRFKVDKFDFNKNTIHIHVPEGAIPKDGPSAGIAFTTALISALSNQPVKQNLALTGEITLRGKVLPIGGLKEKTLGATEAGIRTIIFPEANKQDEKDLSNKVKKLATIHMVNNYFQIYDLVFK